MILKAAVLAIAMSASLAFAASDDFEVQDSNVAAHPQGQTLQRGSQVKLPDGGRLVLIDRTGPSVQTRICVGRYEGEVESCPSGCSWWRKILAMCHDNNMIEGGTRHIN